MSTLNNTDSLLLARLKTEIEKISGLKAAGDFTQKDYEFLIYYIEEKTGNRLSLTTIKRIWRNEFQRLPHLSTLDMLAQLAYQVNWMTLRKDFIEKHPIPEADNRMPETVHATSGKSRSRNAILIFTVAPIILLVILWFLFQPHTAAEDLSKVQFSARSTVDDKIPNTVVFTYDVSSLAAKKFFIQQSWDPMKKVAIAKDNNQQTDIYYDPGYHYAKLIADDRVIKEIPVHVRCADWFVRLRYPDGGLTHVAEPNLNRDDYLSVKSDYFTNPDTKPRSGYSLGYMLSKDFNISADHFQFSSRFKIDTLAAPECPGVAILIKGTHDYFYIPFGNKGCESNLNYRCSDTHVSGKTTDLSAFGTDVFRWQAVDITVANRKVLVSLNNKLIREITYTKAVGDLKEVDFLFYGDGAIDEVSMDEKGKNRYYYAFAKAQH